MGHELQPAYLELRQTGPKEFEMLWKVPARPELQGIHARLPDDVKYISEPVRIQTSEAFIERSTITSAGGLYGESISIDPASAALIDTLVRVVRSDNSTQVGRLNAVSTSILIDGIPNRFEQ